MSNKHKYVFNYLDTKTGLSLRSEQKSGRKLTPKEAWEMGREYESKLHNKELIEVREIITSEEVIERPLKEDARTAKEDVADVPKDSAPAVCAKRNK